MHTKNFFFTLKSTFELFRSSPRKEKIFIKAAGCLWGPYATNWYHVILTCEKKHFVHITQHEGLQKCLTAKPSGSQSTELSIVWHPGSSLLRMETQAPFNFTNICFYLLLCPEDNFLSFTLASPLISYGMDK